MADLLNGLKRTKMCGEFRAEDIGSRAVVMGHIAKHRDLGNLVFIDVRDRTGLVQVSIDDSCGEDIYEKATRLRSEFVVAVSGVVRSRGDNINKNIPTGEIEILAEDVRILSEAEVPPFVVKDDVNANETLRLRYRYLDLRRPIMQERMIMRDRATKSIRNYLSENGFLEIETPFLGKSTPEGARDYLVPSRIHEGCFYALPQSPQLYKQLLMISGYDRYYQVARCFRDEDLRANRQPEFTQIDMEISYVESEEDVMGIAEGMIKRVFLDCKGIEFKEDFKRIPYSEAMERYGSDKPDTRFDMQLVNISDIAKDCGFSVFEGAVASGGSVRLINAKGMADTFTRKVIDQLTEDVKTFGAKGLAYALLKSDGSISSPIAKFIPDGKLQAIYQAANANKGDALFFVASDSNRVVLDSLGNLRCHLANKFNLIDKDVFDILWVTSFPLFDYSEEEDRLVSMHHPFTSVKEEDIELLESNPLKVRSKAYDLVINGQEAGGGSIRIHTVDMQRKMFKILGLSEEDIKSKFGFFVDAFRYGAPPHGGIAFGLDRLVMLLNDTDSIRDVIAFPKVQNASCLMSQAPSRVEEQQLDELSLSIKESSERDR